MANDKKKPSVTDGILSDSTSSVVDFNKDKAWKELERLNEIQESGRALTKDQQERRAALLREITARGAAAEGDRASGAAALVQAQGTKNRLDAEAEKLIPAKAEAMRNTSFVGGQPVSSYDMRMFLATTMTMRQRLEKAIALGMPAPYIESLQRLMLGERNRVEAAKKGRYGLKGYDEDGVAEYGARSIYDTTRKGFNDAVAAALDRADNKAYVAAQKRKSDKLEANKDAKVDALLKELDSIEKMTPEEVHEKYYGKSGAKTDSKKDPVNQDQAYTQRNRAKSDGQPQKQRGASDRSLVDPLGTNVSAPYDPPRTSTLDVDPDKLFNTDETSSNGTTEVDLSNINLLDTPKIDPYNVLGIERPSPDKNDGRQADELGGVMMSPRGWLDAYLSGGAR